MISIDAQPAAYSRECSSELEDNKEMALQSLTRNGWRSTLIFCHQANSYTAQYNENDNYQHTPI